MIRAWISSLCSLDLDAEQSRKYTQGDVDLRRFTVTTTIWSPRGGDYEYYFDILFPSGENLKGKMVVRYDPMLRKPYYPKSRPTHATICESSTILPFLGSPAMSIEPAPTGAPAKPSIIGQRNRSSHSTRPAQIDHAQAPSASPNSALHNALI